MKERVRPPSVSLREVAKAADVSLSTASKVLTGRYGNARISAPTVERVRAHALRLGYVPNQIARNLREKRTGQIGIVLRPLDTESRLVNLAFDGTILVGLNLAASEHHLPAVVMYTYLEDDGMPDPARYLDGRIDGLLVRSHRRSEEQLLHTVDHARLPVVALWRQDVLPDEGFADADHRGGAHQAVAHLLGLGHRRIAFLRLDLAHDNYHFDLRSQGYDQALEEAGITPRPEWVATDHASIMALLRAPEPITAVFAASDLLAENLARDLLAAGIRIPDDLSLVGFDDVGLASVIAGGLTTVHHPVQEMTVEAVRNLLAMIGGAPAERCRSIVPTHLVVRHSTAPPAGADQT